MFGYSDFTDKQSDFAYFLGTAAAGKFGGFLKKNQTNFKVDFILTVQS